MPVIDGKDVTPAEMLREHRKIEADLLTCGDCNALLEESECVRVTDAVTSEAWGQVATMTTTHLACGYCGSQEVADAEVRDVLAKLDDMTRERNQLMRMLNTAQARIGELEFLLQLKETA